MKHRTFAPALGALGRPLFGSRRALLCLSPPIRSGIWAKDDGSAKMEVKKCGRGICSKIVWLQDAERFARASPCMTPATRDPSMRDRPIIGLPLFGNMVPTEPNTWVGNVYNPEEGHDLYRRQGDARLAAADRAQGLQGLAPLRREDTGPGRSFRRPRRSLRNRSPSKSRRRPSPTPPMSRASARGASADEAKAHGGAQRARDAPKASRSRADRRSRAREPMPDGRKPIAGSTGRRNAVANARGGESVGSAAQDAERPPRPPSQRNSMSVSASSRPRRVQDPLPLSGENVSSMIVMTSPAAGTEATEPEVTEATVESAADREPRRPAAGSCSEAEGEAQARSRPKPRDP